MESLSTLGYAWLAGAVYDDNQTEIGGFARQILRRNDISGFHGAVYKREAGGVPEYVLSFAGSETSEGGIDWVADLGFGGKKVAGAMQRAGAVMQVLGVLPDAMGNIAEMAGRQLTLLANKAQAAFMAQQIAALQLTHRALQAAKGNKLTLTGHSLGGGLAQIAAAHSGLPAVTFSAPTVSAVEGASAAFDRRKPTIVNFRIKNDPVNISELTGQRIGRVVTLMSPRSIATAHQLPNTIAELVSQGQFAITGRSDPFTITAAFITS